jgi:hypothetical protein
MNGAGSKKGHDSNLDSSGKNKQNHAEVNTQPSNSKNSSSKKKPEDKDDAKKAKFTMDKYGHKVPVLSDIADSNLMIIRNNSKEQI